MDQYYMNPKTGDVKPADDWRAESEPVPMSQFARWAAIHLIEVREPRTESEFADYGCWVPASVDDNKNDGDDDEYYT